MIGSFSNDKVITNIATVAGILASILIALNIGMFILGYVLFGISSILWSIYAYKNKNKQLLVMNLFFTFINCVGFIRFY